MATTCRIQIMVLTNPSVKYKRTQQRMTIADESRILFIRLPAAVFLTTENLQIREMRKMSPAEFDRWEEEREKEATEKESAAGEDSLQNSALITPIL